jgi:hypothetical protein
MKQHQVGLNGIGHLDGIVQRIGSDGRKIGRNNDRSHGLLFLLKIKAATTILDDDDHLTD